MPFKVQELSMTVVPSFLHLQSLLHLLLSVLLRPIAAVDNIQYIATPDNDIGRLYADVIMIYGQKNRFAENRFTMENELLHLSLVL